MRGIKEPLLVAEELGCYIVRYKGTAHDSRRWGRWRVKRCGCRTRPPRVCYSSVGASSLRSKQFKPRLHRVLDITLTLFEYNNLSIDLLFFELLRESDFLHPYFFDCKQPIMEPDNSNCISDLDNSSSIRKSGFGHESYLDDSIFISEFHIASALLCLLRNHTTSVDASYTLHQQNKSFVLPFAQSTDVPNVNSNLFDAATISSPSCLVPIIHTNHGN
ncbi:uncharacterized protein A4U43_C07F11200 [Asparagus officinalis]|uniref:Uncharacterized protein n=1 Tax=Asparagus officinalis TaxID=4686 RepID=A0A5P1EG85_ASPOF|nr:uncharacterized protein A4U43_C07F11200 [Asparagus officinalis]